MSFSNLPPLDAPSWLNRLDYEAMGIAMASQKPLDTTHKHKRSAVKKKATDLSITLCEKMTEKKAKEEVNRRLDVEYELATLQRYAQARKSRD